MLARSSLVRSFLHKRNLFAATTTTPVVASFSSEATEATPLTETVRTFLNPDVFSEQLKKHGIDFVCGVPDSLLKEFCGFCSDIYPASRHVIAVNEGAAIGIAAGYHLATGKVPLVYMQNSGLGNAVNPLLSLCNNKVYSIPMLLLIGWRGEPGKKDEPQHRVQGKMTPGMLASMDIPFETLPDYEEGSSETLQTAVDYMTQRNCPYALLVKRQTFSQYKFKSKVVSSLPLTREDFLSHALHSLGEWDALVHTTGFTSREVYELREKAKQSHKSDFLTVGSMGHASAIALGIAFAKPTRQVVCIDGDGAMLMHMGTLCTIGQSKQRNIKHIVVNNGAHDSVGAQPTGAFNIDIPAIASACGYKAVFTADNEDKLKQQLSNLMAVSGPALLEVRVRPGARADLGRPKSDPKDNKAEFMQFLQH